MIVKVENSKESTKKLVFLIVEIRKIVGYRVNNKQSIVFLHIINEKLEITIQ